MTSPPWPERISRREVEQALRSLGLSGVTSFTSDANTLTVTRVARNEHGEVLTTDPGSYNGHLIRETVTYTLTRAAEDA